ncbi:MAG TPA: glycosyltransferase family 1 protein [Verrucomicrobiae bacterium]
MLLGNYAPDQQESMQHFAQMLLGGLLARGVAVELVRVQPIFGRIGSGASGVGKWLGYLDKFFLFPRALKRLLRSLGSQDVLHICDHSNAIYTKYAGRIPHLVTCHDMLAVRSALGEIPENRTRFPGRIYQRKILHGLNRARRVACVSNATKVDVERITKLKPNQITVVENGLNYPYGPIERSEAIERVAAKIGARPNRFILHVGGNQWYKNRHGVVGIYAELLKILPEGPDLYLVGKTLTRELEAQIDAMKIRERVRSLAGCDNEDLRALYSAADALLFPSLAEGFGWPIIEAQACGCPVVTSNFAPMNEVGGDGAVFIDPKDSRSAAATLRDLLWESGMDRAVRRQKLVANAGHFSADRMIDRYLLEYRALTAG